MTNWSKVGKSSRAKGARFERKCKIVMEKLTGWPDWIRATAGHEQTYGDLVPVNKDGTFADMNTYVECKYRKKINWKEVERFRQGIETECCSFEWYLLVGEPLGPVYVFYSPTNNSIGVDAPVLGPAVLII